MNLRLVALTAVVLLAYSHVGTPVLAAPDETHAAAVLFKKFETVFHATPAILSGSSNELTTEPFAYLLAGLDAVQPKVRSDVLRSGQAVLIGAKDYRAPLGLGPVRSTRCYVIVLSRDTKLDLSQYFKQVEVARAAMNAPVWHWQANLQEFGEEDTRPSMLFATQISNSYMVVSNDLQELLKVSASLVSSDKTESKVLARIHQWQQMKGHAFWGYRRYKHQHSSSGLRRLSGLGGVSPSAEGLAVYIEPERQRVVLRLFSSNLEDPTAANISRMYSMPSLKPVGAGVWQADFVLTQGSGSDAALGVLSVFGWGVVV